MSPIFSRGYKFIITTMEYFTKWVEAISMISTKRPKVVEFIQNHITYHFGIPTQIIIDNEKHFKNKEVQALCKEYHI